MLELLDRQIEEVRSNGNYYKQRIDQLQQEPAPLTDSDQRRIAHERELSDATAQQGRLQAQAHEAGPLREEQKRLLLRVGELDGALKGLVESYDQARHEAVVREARALEPLALQAERFRVVADRSEAISSSSSSRGPPPSRSPGPSPISSHALPVSDTARRPSRTFGIPSRRRNGRAARPSWPWSDRVRREGLPPKLRRRSLTVRRSAINEKGPRPKPPPTWHIIRSWTARSPICATISIRACVPTSPISPPRSLRDLTDARYTDLELDEDYSTTLVDDGDPKAVISGGEEDVANLAFRLAISQMIAELAGQPLSLLILDEIFGSLDDAHRSAVTDLLRSLADRFSQVILVTHIESLRDGFDRVVRVGFDLASGVATVRDEPLGDRDVAA